MACGTEQSRQIAIGWSIYIQLLVQDETGMRQIQHYIMGTRQFVSLHHVCISYSSQH